MRVATAFLYTLVLLSTGWGQSSNVSLQDTVDWLQTKSHLITYVGASTLRETVEAKRGSTWTVALKEPCILELSSTGKQEESRSKTLKPRIVVNPEIQAPENPSSIFIPLSSINPQRITTATMKGPIAGGHGNVQLVATDEKAMIPWRGKDKTVHVKSVTIGFDQEGMTQRVAKALTHAVNLCGGRTDKKEPF